MSRRLWQILSLVAAVSVAILVAVTSASASNTRERVGAVPAFPHGAKLGHAVPGDQALNLTIAMQPQNAAALQSYATAVATPGSALYRHYLSVAQFAQRFGATPAAIANVESALRAQGLTVGQPTANNLTIPAHGTAAQVEKAFAVSESQVALPSGRTAYANDQAPTLPSSTASDIQGVIGLDNVTLPQPQGFNPHHHLNAQAVRRAARLRAETSGGRDQALTSGPQPCLAATEDAANDSGYTSDQIASMYGLSDYYPSDEGSGETIGLFEQQPYDPTDAATYQACYGTSASITNVNVDGGPGPYTPGTSDDGEATLDLDILLGIAPKANIIVYQAPGTATSAADILSTMVSQDQAKVLSSSWGACEALTEQSVINSENTTLQEAAVQGQSFFISAGDAGSTQCYQSSGGTNDSLSVLDPASQPFATGVGGTFLGNQTTGELPDNGVYPAESVWNDGGAGGGGRASGSGGGVSDQFAMPSYQSAASGSLDVIQSDSSRTCGGQFCREVPDVSADADPHSGYAVFSNGSWTVTGGTSGAAPLWAAFITLADAYPTCRGFTLGFVNPSLYQIAGSAYLANFHDITLASPWTGEGNNDTFEGTNTANPTSLYPVQSGYDMTTGLGTPIANALGPALCSLRAPVYAVSVASPGNQKSIVGHAVSLTVHGADSGSQPLAYADSALPAGLTMSTAGVITGTPTTAQSLTVTVAAHDQFTNAGQTSFTWTVMGNPSATKVNLSGLTKKRPKLTAKLVAGAGAPALKSVSIKLPKGFSFAKKAKTLKKGLSVKSGSRKLKFTTKVKRGVLTITFKKTTRTVSLTVARPALSITASEARKIHKHKIKKLAVTFTTTDTSHVSTTLKVELKKLK